MKDNDKSFENEPTPIAKAMNKKRDTVASFSTQNNASKQFQDWDDDKTEVLISTELSGSSQPLLVEEDGTKHSLSHFPYSIGRDHDCDLQPNGRGISRRHAEISIQAGRIVIRDLGSSNGVKVNGYNVSQVLLEDQDVLSIGDCNFTFTQALEEYSEPQINWGVEIPPPHTIRAEHQKSSKSNLHKLIGVIAVGTGLLFIGGYFYKVNNRTLTIPPEISQKNEQTAEAPEAKVTTAAINKPAINESNAQETKAAQKANIDAANKPVTTAETSNSSSAQLKKSAKHAPKTAALTNHTTIPSIPQRPNETLKTPEQVPNNNTQSTDAVLSSAEKHYQTGHADKAINSLEQIGSDPNLSAAAGDKINKLYMEFKNLHKLYLQANLALEQGQSDEAVDLWAEYVDKAKLIIPDQSSPYQMEAIQFLAKKYEVSARTAEQNKNYQDAYINWRKLYKLTGNSQAKAATEALNTLARDMYRNGLRQEYVNTKKAIEYWQKTQAIVAPENEYYQKAEAKLALHNRWN